MSRRPQPTLLKLIRGDLHESRLKDEKPKNDGLPLVPPGAILNADERAMWDWLMAEVAVPGVHGTGDGAAFVKIAKLWVRVCEADAKCESKGLVMKNPQTSKPELQPYTRLSRDLWQQLGIALAEVGATPSGRVKLAGPRGARGLGEATSWDEID